MRTLYAFFTHIIPIFRKSSYLEFRKYSVHTSTGLSEIPTKITLPKLKDSGTTYLNKSGSCHVTLQFTINGRWYGSVLGGKIFLFIVSSLLLTCLFRSRYSLCRSAACCRFVFTVSLLLRMVVPCTP
jgi:hypothetical protein